MKALVWQGPHRMAVEERPEPRPGPGWVVVRPAAAGVCGSEVEGYAGRQPNRRPPLVMGHEFAGEVVELGEGVDAVWLARRVAVNPVVGCGRCRACRSGATNACPERALIGVQHPGGFAERVSVPAGSLVELPAGLDLRLGALVEPMANGVHALGLGLALGAVDRALVVGAGTIGLCCLQAALASGVPEVAIVEPHEARRAAALGMGAHRAHAALDEAEPGLDLVVDAVGAGATRRAAAALARPGGVCVFVGLHDDETPLGFHRLIRDQVTLRGSYAYSREEFATALAWLATGRARVGELSSVLPLERGPEVFAGLASAPSASFKLFLADGA